MRNKKLKIIVLTHGGADHLLELLTKLETVEVAGIFIETVTEKRRGLKEKIIRSIKYDGYRETCRKFANRILGRESASAQMQETILEAQQRIGEIAEQLAIPLYRVENYHRKETKQMLRETGADLGILYGTNIIRKSVFTIPRMGSINIHQGLAPYYRGGPSVFWELFNGEKEIGITVHFVAPKVDTGDLILQKALPLEYDFEKYGLDYERFLDDFREHLREPSSRLVFEAVKLIAEGKEQRTRQDTSLGKRYRLPLKREKDALVRILKSRRREAIKNKRKARLPTINYKYQQSVTANRAPVPGPRPPTGPPPPNETKDIANNL